MNDVSCIRATLALAFAIGRHVPLPALYSRAEVEQWRGRAEEIEDLELRELALAKLDGERFNAEAAAVLASHLPAAQRRPAVEAILALEIMFDYLDGLTERPLDNPLADGKRLFDIFVAALPEHESSSAPEPPPGMEMAARYLEELRAAAHGALAQLPAWEAVTLSARRCALRGAEAQTRMHAAGRLGLEQLREWALTQTRSTGMGWRETVAGSACAVLALHALVVAAADSRTTAADAAEIESSYMPLCACVTLLDCIADRERDLLDGERGYAALYGDEAALGNSLRAVAARARSAFAGLPDAPRHTAALTAALAYGLSAPGARGHRTAEVLAPLRDELGSLLAPPLLLMRAWRGLEWARAASRAAAINGLQWRGTGTRRRGDGQQSRWAWPLGRTHYAQRKQDGRAPHRAQVGARQMGQARSKASLDGLEG